MALEAASAAGCTPMPACPSRPARRAPTPTGATWVPATCCPSSSRARPSPARSCATTTYAAARAALRRPTAVGPWPAIHPIPVDAVPGLERVDQVRQYREVLDDVRRSASRPSSSPSAGWRPTGPSRDRRGDRRRSHGDFRLGNLMVGPDGLRAVVDWELAHLGDPDGGPRLAVRAGVALRRRRSPSAAWAPTTSCSRRTQAASGRPIDPRRGALVGGARHPQVGDHVHHAGPGPPGGPGALDGAGRHRPPGRARTSTTCSCCSNPTPWPPPSPAPSPRAESQRRLARSSHRSRAAGGGPRVGRRRRPRAGNGRRGLPHPRRRERAGDGGARLARGCRRWRSDHARAAAMLGVADDLELAGRRARDGSLSGERGDATPSAESVVDKLRVANPSWFLSPAADARYAPMAW